MNLRLKLMAATLAAVALFPAVAAHASEYALDYGNGYAQNVESDTGFLVGEVYVISPALHFVASVAPLVPVAVVASVVGVPHVTGLITAAAARWRLDPARMLRIAKCESGFDPRAKNRSSTASGVFQFLNTTWAATPQGRAGQSVFDAEANIEGAMWLMQTYGPGQWVCK